MIDREAKRQAARRKRLLRKMARHERHQIKRCWWTWPLGHYYEQHEDETWRCAGCGREARSYDLPAGTPMGSAK